MLEFKLAAIMPSSESKTKQSVIYLFNRQQALLLPITISILEEHNILENLNPNGVQADIYEFTKKVIKLLKGHAECVILQDLVNNICYSYIRVIDLKKNILDMGINIKDALIVAIKFNIPILVSEKIMEKRAIKVTKEMLENII